MASTIAFYTGDGATTDFTVPFDYLAKKFVRVSLGVTILKGGDYGDTSKDYYFLDKTKVRLKVPPQVGEVLTIRRYTSATDRVVSFKDASVLKAADLDVSAVQTIHIAEEARDIINDALIKDKEGNWDAKGNRIVNVGTPVADSDAVTYGVYKTDAMGAYQAKLKAEAARDAAKASEVNSKASEVNAKESEVTAKASSGTAVSAAKHADAVKTENQAILEEARQLQTNIETSESNAYDNAVIATQQATLATTKASEAEDSATSASQSATAADASAKNASASASTATTQATNASSSAKAAKLSEDNAALSKTAAGTSEANAKASEVEAKKQADLAKGYAEDAASGQLNADWEATDPKSKAFINNKPTLGALASKDSIAYSEITGTPPEQDLSGLATKNELQTGLAGKANASHTHTSASITDLSTTLAPYATTVVMNTELAKKAPASHTHTVSQITDMPNVVLSVNNITPASGGNVDLGLHAVATSGDYNDLRNKPSMPATPKAYITKTWKNESNWYRKWSDGLIEQGGAFMADSSYPTMTFNTPFSNTNYSISGWFGPDPWSNNFPVMLVVGYERKPASFKFYVGYNRDDNYTSIFNKVPTVYWSAVGY